MELICEKYQERMAEAEAICRHPTEYCKFRKSCIIHFLSKDKLKEERATDASRPAEDGK